MSTECNEEHKMWILQLVAQKTWAGPATSNDQSLLLLLLWQYILMDAIQKASQTWGGKRNPGALNGTKKKKKKKKKEKT